MGEEGLVGWPGVKAERKPGPTRRVVVGGKREGSPVWSQWWWLCLDGGVRGGVGCMKVRVEGGGVIRTYLQIMPSMLSSFTPFSSNISFTPFFTSTFQLPSLRRDVIFGARFHQSFRTPRSKSNLRPLGCSIRNE